MVVGMNTVFICNHFTVIYVTCCCVLYGSAVINGELIAAVTSLQIGHTQ